MVSEAVAVAVPPWLSEMVYVKLSDPVKPLVGGIGQRDPRCPMVIGAVAWVGVEFAVTVSA